MDVLALRLALKLPAALGTEQTEHDGLRRAGRGRAHRGKSAAIVLDARLGRLPQVRQDRNAARMDRDRRRILVLVTQVDPDRLDHKLGRLLGHPCLDVRGKVQARLAIEQKLIAEQVVRRALRKALLRQMVLGNGLRAIAASQCVVRHDTVVLVAAGLVQGRVAFLDLCALHILLGVNTHRQHHLEWAVAGNERRRSSPALGVALLGPQGLVPSGPPAHIHAAIGSVRTRHMREFLNPARGSHGPLA